MRGYHLQSAGSDGKQVGATTVSKRSTSAAAATRSDVQDPTRYRRVLNARYKLLRQLEAQAPRTATTTSQIQDEEEEEEDEEEDDVEDVDQGGECWLSRFLAGSLTLVVGGFICYVVVLHQHRLRVLFE